MHHMMPMRVAERAGDIAQNLDGVGDREAAVARHAIAEALAVDEGHRVVEQALR